MVKACDECKAITEVQTFVQTDAGGTTEKELCKHCYKEAQYQQFASEWFIK